MSRLARNTDVITTGKTKNKLIKDGYSTKATIELDKGDSIVIKVKDLKDGVCMVLEVPRKDVIIPNSYYNPFLNYSHDSIL